MRVTEPYSLKTAFFFLQEFAEICQSEGLEKALVDVLILDGRISIWDRYKIGEEYIRVVGPKIRVALVARQSLINLVMENVIVNRGGRLKVFTETKSALKWLGME